MAGEYQLSYTGPQVNEKLGKIDGLEVSLEQIPSTYETKADASAKLTEAKKYTDDLKYILPAASSTKLGGIKVGSGLVISGGLLSTNTVNNLNDTSSVNPLSANQGKILNDTITELKNSLGKLGYGDMLKIIYDTDDDGIVDNAKKLDGISSDGYLKSANPSGTGSLSLNRLSNSDIGNFSATLGESNEASAPYSFASGYQTKAKGNTSVAEGEGTIASGAASHAEGYHSSAEGLGAHAEGGSFAKGFYSHAEGSLTTSFNKGAHSEGLSSNTIPNTITNESSSSDIYNIWLTQNFNLAQGLGSHTEGNNTLALESYSHAEGDSTISQGWASHTEGYFTMASGQGSHAEGQHTQATSASQHVQGKFNIADNQSIYQHIVGNGSSETPSNAHTLDWEGNAWFQGDVYVGSTSGINKDAGSKKLITFDEIPTNISAFTNDSNYITNALLNKANGIAILDENKNLITNEGITITNNDSFYFIDSQDRTVSYIDAVGVHAINIYTTDKEYTKDSSGNPVETIYNLNYELAKLQQLYPLIISDTEPEDAFFWIDTSV